jgi:aspartate/methionine/tyrosine aminotransferase
MEFKPFLLEQWLETYEHSTKYNLAASTGPLWAAKELLDLISDEEKNRLFETPLTYRPASGSESLRQELADWLGVDTADVQICTGASEALLSLFYLAAGAEANVIVPTPGYPAFSAFPESLGLEIRTYSHRVVNAFRLEVDEIKALADKNTKLILVNTPHNPTGSVCEISDLKKLHDFATERGIQFVVDEVYHPIYHGDENLSSVSLPNAIVLGDMSKALCMPALRVGWMIDRNRDRLDRHRNARAYFTISNGLFGEVLSEVAIRNREKVFEKARATAERNLALLDSFFGEHTDQLSWAHPSGGFTGFPRLVSGENSRPLCERAADVGVLLAPGDCFGYPDSVRLGFGACEHGFAEALEILSHVLKA